MVYFSFFLTVFFIICGLLLVISKKNPQVNKRISTYLEEEGQPQSGLQNSDGRIMAMTQIKDVLLSVWNLVARVFKKRMPVVKVEKMELKLLQAGSPLQMSPFDFKVFQVVSLIVFTLFYGFFALCLGMSDSQILLLFLIGAGFGAVVPKVYINSKIKKRRAQALKELPDFVDLLAVSLEAGLGFDSALFKVVERQKGVLADEFGRCLDEIRLGKTRKEGLTGVKNRLEIEEISTLINSVIRAEKLGVGMVQVLRIQSVEIREKRRQRAEEQAMKAPIKMLFPLVLFIFPCLFIIILGPAVIHIISAFR